jgi:Domain of unknown function (DUF4129)
VERSESPRGGRAGAALAALAVVLGLLALVAVAAEGDTPAGSDGARRPSHLLIDTLVSLYIVLMALGVVAYVGLLLLGRHTADEHGRLRRPSHVQSAVVFVLLLGALALALRLAEERGGDVGEQPAPPAPAATRPAEAVPETGYDPEFALVTVLIVFALVAVVVASLAVAARRRKRALGQLREPALLEALEDVLDESIDDLRAERDPRKAVVAAYARLERTLAAYGLPRRPAEAPAEYLARMLADLEVSHRSIGRLTALFERAKFSQHDVDSAMKEEAIDALQTTREELRAARERELVEHEAALAEARERAGRA